MNVTVNAYHRYLKYSKILRIILVKKPLVILRVLNNYFQIYFFKKKIVRKVEMGVTFGCQFGCAKCSSEFMKDPKGDPLTKEEIDRVAKDVLALGAVQINITGGEPTLAKNLFEVIESFQPHKVVMTMNTNGFLLTEKMIDRLEEAGMDILKISLDSPYEEEHDKSRVYPGSFKQVIKALGYIKKKKRIMAQISTVCIKENLNSERIYKLIDMAKEYNATLGLTIPAATGRWVDDKDVLIGKKEQEILRKIIKVPHVVRDTDEGYTRSHCPAGSEEFYLTSYGDVIPCPLIQISFGNVREKSVEQIWKNMTDFDGFKEKEKPGCIAGENKDFIDSYLAPLKDFKVRPVRIENHPVNKNPNKLPEKVISR